MTSLVGPRDSPSISFAEKLERVAFLCFALLFNDGPTLDEVVASRFFLFVSFLSSGVPPSLTSEGVSLSLFSPSSSLLLLPKKNCLTWQTFD